LPAGHTDIGLHEGDRLHITSPSDSIDTMFNDLLRTSVRATDSEADWASALLRPDIRPRVLSDRGLDSGQAQQQTADLLRLFQRVDLLLSPSEDLMSGAGRSRLLRPLVCRQLLDEVERRMAQARRGYVNVVRERTAIRGRALAPSIARYEVTGTPLLLCRYDELTESTELLGIVAAALDVVAEGRGTSSVLPAPFDERRLRKDAVRLRRALADVVSLPIWSAVPAAARLRLNRLDQPWSKALRLSLTLLSDQELLATRSQARDFQAVELSVETDKVWEWVVKAALRRTVFDHVLPQGPRQRGWVVDPWVSHPLQVSTTTRPDNIAIQSSSIFVVDAKYKIAVTPSRDDQYQMFAYSHLVRGSGRKVQAAVLVYPGHDRTMQWRRGRDAGTPVRLFSVYLPFPGPRDLLSHDAWEGYLRGIGSRLESQLELVGRTPDLNIGSTAGMI
jgi:5-methylcytosine-specific restriction endonuclease McrBC regulatory subunit McrC